MIWMISANGKMYDHASSFATNGFIDWRQRAKYSNGDIVYIYCTRPFMRVMYKCEVIKHSMPFSACVDDGHFWIDRDEYEKSKSGEYARLKLLEQVDTMRLSLDMLKSHGLSAAPQGPIKVSPQLNKYIEQYFNDYYTEGFFSDIAEQEQYHEGHVRSVLVDKYERSSIARGKCIEHHGSSCLICGIDFGEKYGDLGEGFIHIHHLRPLHTIKKDYVVDYKNDLIPVCPNCHAMIHRIPNGENMSVEEIKVTLQNVKSCTKVLTQNKPNETPQKYSNSKPTTIIKQSPTKISEDDATRLSKIKKGSGVKHKTFGDGKITKLDIQQKHISVLFGCGEKTFVIDAFEKGFLTLIE